MSSAKNKKAFIVNPYHLLRWSLASTSASWLGVKVEYIQCGLGAQIREALTTIRVVTSQEQEGVGGSRERAKESIALVLSSLLNKLAEVSFSN